MYIYMYIYVGAHLIRLVGLPRHVLLPPSPRSLQVYIYNIYIYNVYIPTNM